MISRTIPKITAAMTAAGLALMMAGCGPKPDVPPVTESADTGEPVMTVEERIEVARAYLDQGRVGDAAEHYRSALADVPDDFDVNLNLGLALMRIEEGKFENQRDYAEIRRYLVTARDLRSDDPRPYIHLGTLDFKQKDYAGAVEHLSVAERLAPSDEAVQEMLGVAMMKLGMESAAEKHLRRTLEINPGNAVANLEIGRLEERLGRNPSAIRHLEQALRADPNLDMATWLLERAYYEEGMNQAAEETCKRFLKYHPDDIQSLEILGWVFKRQERTAEMLDAYERLRRIEPGNTAYWSPAIQHYMENEDYESARRVLEQSLEHNPYYAYGNVRYGQVLIHYGDRSLSAGNSREALDLYSQARKYLEKARVDDRYERAASQLIDRAERAIRRGSGQ